MAGRKDKNTVDYFPHYCISGKTLFVLESKFNHIGYAVWFKTLELLGSSENHYIDLRDEVDLLFLISKLKITEEQLNNIYNLLAKLDAIDLELWENNIIFSSNFIENIKDAYKRRSNKCMHKLDLCKHLSIKCKQKSNLLLHKSTKKRKEKERKVNKSKVVLPFETEIFVKYWNLWKQYKRDTHNFKYKTETSEQTALKQLNDISQNNQSTAIIIIENSMANQYKGLFKLKNNNNGTEKRITTGEMLDYINRDRQ